MSKGLKKISKEFEVVEIEKKDALIIKKKNEELIVYDSEIISNLIERKFMEEYKKILYLLTTSEDDDGTGQELVIYQISYLRELLIKEYSKFISKSLLKKYLNMLNLLNGKVMYRKIEKGYSR